MRKISMAALSLMLLLSGCAPSFQKEEGVVQTKEKSKEKAIIPKYKISDKYYQTILPFEPGEARGLVVNNLNTRFDINEFETGLMRIAQNTFDPDKYVFREGQELKRDKVKLWLNRKFTPQQLAEEKLKEEENIGLNPLDDGKGDIKERNIKNPIYLAHILEHDYLIKGDNNTVSLGGVVIGLALNSVHYYQTEAFGDTFEKKIPKDEMEREGKKIAQEVVKRLRGMKEFNGIPIMVGLFEQQSASSVVPGNFFAYTNVGKDSSNIDGWETVNEKYVLFPSTEATEKHRDDATAFLNFKQDVEEYFPNFNGVIGRAFYVGDQFQELNVSIPIQFFGKAEAIGFTQYVTGLVMEHFPDYLSVQVSITSVNGPEALIVRKAQQKEPFVHIY
ncbi:MULTISPECIES: CamS family sex pheromone protein [unclassified Bacillus (in: firmicutes)]|uniref:CamS family sex pheromone protein n=1 Tax=unclassified Bacillus (in: firmicutes) TaxID=185979 RepID=UPI0008EAA895|nr:MULTISPECIES: CamS family sex pheromone protein [unclassified Bacillus (in: firmicutes)]SFB23517.1 Protein involved in sex pheromone biosynthesis [Bacillus sp. UNCCL13]SFQ87803.1 Protein involved in sex pheromone biosynthesis [Bacillus sp. cl95]